MTFLPSKTIPNNKIEIDHDISDNPKIEESTGIVTWDLNLTPKENKKLLLEYKISYPKESWIAVD